MSGVADALPSLAVVIPHYGEPQPTRDLVAALCSQEYAGPLEVIVVDDCSPEPLRRIPGARALHRAENGGFGSAVNTGVREASSELLLILNSDVEFEPGFLRDFVRAAVPWMPAVASPWVVGADGAPAYPGHRWPTLRGRLTEQLHPLYRFEGSRVVNAMIGRRGRAERTTVVDWLTGCALLLPREQFLRVGGFDETFFMNCEETDLQRRLGLPAVLLGDVSLVHAKAGSSDPAKRRGWLSRSQVRYAEKWGSPASLRATWTVAALVNAVWDGARTLAGRRTNVRGELVQALSLAWRR